MSFKLTSEFGNLEAVIVHRPGKEIDRLTPDNKSEFLFTDMPFLQDMQKEHDHFTSTLLDQSDAKVYEVQQLLTDVLINDSVCESIVSKALISDGNEEISNEFVQRFSAAQIANFLITGIKKKEIDKSIQKHFNGLNEEDYIIQPSPNLYFMRDPAIVTQGGIISSRMKFKARQKETNLLSAIIANHPLFESNKIIYPNDKVTLPHPNIEGGDVIILSDKAIAIGNSERSDSEAIQAIASELLSNGDIERCYEVKLPSERHYMHLDTVFTVVDENLVVSFPKAIQLIQETTIHTAGKNADSSFKLQSETLKDSFLEILKEEMPFLQIVQTAGGNVDYAAREQWFDGANVFCIGPRRVISYNRNIFTNRALKNAGVEVYEIPSSELSRGLGGPRCMTMSLSRADFFKRD